MREHILILDDDTATLEVLQILLNYAGFDSIVIEQTDDLFSLVRVHRPSLILLDFCLNGRDGGYWCTQLKNDPEFAGIPVIIFTAGFKVLENGSYGCDDFIAKPFDLDDIIARIKRLIDKNDKATGEDIGMMQVKPEHPKIWNHNDNH